jgi:hypothetical protein
MAAALLAACGGSDEALAPPVPGSGEKVVHVYNWTDYIGKTTAADFTARTGIRVVYDTYDSNELVETKLLTGRTGYDVVFPTATILARMARIGVFLELDKAKLPNLVNLDSDVMTRMSGYDPGNLYAIPYMWGTTGLGYNPEMVKKALGRDTIDSWGAVFDPAIASKLAACGITMLDAHIALQRGSGRALRGRGAGRKGAPLRALLRFGTAPERARRRRGVRVPELERPDAAGPGPRRVGLAARHRSLRDSPRRGTDVVRRRRDTG